MKKIYMLLGFFAATLTSVTAQSIQGNTVSIINDLPQPTMQFHNSQGLGKTNACGFDTVNYTNNKATAYQAVTMNSVSSGNAFSQWFPAPQQLTVSGFDFFAWQSAGTNAVITLTCRMYNSTNDSLPLGAPLASVTLTVDSSFGGGLLSVLRKRAVFSTPVTTSSAYVLTIESSSSVNVGVVANSWTANPPNGRSEWLSSVRIGTNYIRGYNVNIGSIRFNADFIIDPFVSYSLTAGFTPSTLCNQGGNSITFTNSSSPVLFSPFYSLYAFYNISQFNCMWDYGDTTGTYYAVNGTKTYTHNIPYTVKLKDTLYGWTRGCMDEHSVMLGATPAAPNIGNNGPVCVGGTLRLYADTIPGVSYYWTGPNGFTSTQQNPVLTNVNVSMIGNYVARTILGQCSSAVSQTYVNIVSTVSAANNGPVCTGQSLNLNATSIAGATYSWSGPNSFSSSLQNPSITNASTSDSGNYSVTVNMAGCGTLGPYTTLAVVNVVPTTPTVNNNGPLCVGDNLNLSASNYAGGTYNWTGPNNFSSTQQNPSRASVQNTFAGTYSVTISKNGCTSSAGSTTVIINNIPNSPVSGNNGPLCVGQTLSLTATPVSGASYAWSGPNNFSSTSQNPTRGSLTLADAGTYSVVASSNGCSSAPSSTTVVITSNTPSPTVSSNGPLCPGQNLQLTASTIIGATYSWTGPNSFSSSSQNPTINNVSSTHAGTYSVTANTSACGTSSPASINLVINSLPATPIVSNNGPLCNGDTLRLVSSGITGATYAWSGPDGFSSTSQGPTLPNVTSLKAGTYSVSASVAGCGTSSPGSTTVVIRARPSAPIVSANSSFCSSDTMVLHASSASTGPNVSYLWNGPNSFASNLQHPLLQNISTINSGTYSVSATDSGCTSALAYLTLNVRSLPSAPTASSNGPICAGGNLLLYASAVSGASYLWTGPNGFSLSAQNPMIPSAGTNASGTYNVKAVVNGCSSSLSSVNVVINALPATPVVSNSGPKCVGDNITLSASLIQNVSYSWTGPNGFSSTQQNPVLSNVTTGHAGIYNVITISSNCASEPGSTDVVVNAYPAAPKISSYPLGAACIGDSLQLFADFVKGAVYVWTGPAGFGSTLQNPIVRNISAVHAGTYSATLEKGGCSSPAATLSIITAAKPQTSNIIGATNVAARDTQTYSVNGSAGSRYLWNVGGGNILGTDTANSIRIMWPLKGNGILYVTETNAAGCSGTPKQMTVTIGYGIGIEKINHEESVHLYPNPANQTLNIELNLQQPRPINIMVMNALGQQVLESLTAGTIQQGSLQLNLETLRSGLYFVCLDFGTEKKTFKVCKE